MTEEKTLIEQFKNDPTYGSDFAQWKRDYLAERERQGLPPLTGASDETKTITED